MCIYIYTYICIYMYVCIGHISYDDDEKKYYVCTHLVGFD